MSGNIIKKDISLSPRLDMLLTLSGEGGCICDVGCDHGFLSIASVLSGRFDSAIAMDVNEGPLLSAKKNAGLYGVSDMVSLRRSDGLEALAPGEADVILMAGMGGALIQRIISGGMDVAKSANRLILSPQSEIADVRKFLLCSGFFIADEDAAEDDGKFYFAMDVRPGDGEGYPFKEAGLTFGGRLLEKRHPILKSFLLKRHDTLSQLLANPKVAKSERVAEIKSELSLADEALGIYES